MPTALSVDAFVDLVQRSRLLSADQVQKVLQELAEDGTEVDDPQALADALVDRDLLTRWQVGFLLKGKHNGFFLGSYRFLNMLGKGGMGAVYLARHEMMRRQCAIKVLPTKLISDRSSVLERFYLEAQAVAALDDPNIVRAYDVNKEVQGKREIHYLVMEYVNGSDLQVQIGKVGPLDYVQVADYARQAASGLAHAHECGLIHRDIKPANLLLDEKGTVKILDLGLARFFDDSLDASLTTTHNESILGTADYLSPEQALDSHNVDTRTDIYSLGCTCYFMLTGQPPFPEGSVAQRLLSHQVKSPTSIEKLRADVPVDLVTIVEKMIAKSPDDRYQTAAEVVDAFGAWLARHADDNWKETHQEVLDGSASHARREPTRARSAATEDTDLELGLAPTEDQDLELAPAEVATPVVTSSATQVPSPAAPTSPEAELGLDELEELEPATSSFDVNASSSGVDDLLSEALENFPAMDSNPNLAAAALGSGIQRAPEAAASPKTEQTQLFKLILIGFAVSVPLAMVILYVSQPSSPPAPPRRQVSDAGSLPAPEAQPRSEPAHETPPSPAPSSPADADAAPDQTEIRPTVVAPDTAETPAKADPTPAPRVPKSAGASAATPPTETTTTNETNPVPPRSEQTAPTNPAPAPATTPSSPKPTPPATSNPPKKKASNAKNKRGSPADTEKSAPPPPTAETIEQLLAGLSTVAIQLDREPQKNAYDQMAFRTAQEALENAGLTVTFQPQGAPAVLTLSFAPAKDDAFSLVNMGAELTCRDSDSNEVCVWEASKEVFRVRGRLGPKPPSGLRSKVSEFYRPLIKEIRLAAAAAKKP